MSSIRFDSLQNGDGLVDTPEKQQAIVDRIKEEMERIRAIIPTRRSSSSQPDSPQAGTPQRKLSNTVVEAVMRFRRTLSRRQSSNTSTDMTKLRVHVTYW